MVPEIVGVEAVDDGVQALFQGDAAADSIEFGLAVIAAVTVVDHVSRQGGFVGGLEAVADADPLGEVLGFVEFPGCQAG